MTKKELPVKVNGDKKTLPKVNYSDILHLMSEIEEVRKEEIPKIKFTKTKAPNYIINSILIPLKYVGLTLFALSLLFLLGAFGNKETTPQDVISVAKKIGEVKEYHINNNSGTTNIQIKIDKK